MPSTYCVRSAKHSTAQHNNESQETEQMLNKSEKKYSKKILFKDSNSILYCIKFCLNAFFFDFSIRCYSCANVFGYQFCHGHIFHFVDGYCIFVICIWSSFAFPNNLIHRRIREKWLPISLVLARTHTITYVSHTM